MYKGRLFGVCIISVLGATLLGYPILAPLVEGEQVHRARGCPTASPGDMCPDVAFEFLRKISGRPVTSINCIKLGYEVTLEREWKVRMNIPASLEFKKSGRGYTAIFRLGEPVGADPWGSFILFVYGRYTKEYREMMKDIESTLVERLHLLKGRCVTESLTEILPEKDGSGKNQGFKIVFDSQSGLVKLWRKGATSDCPEAIDYKDQEGPLTGFFNYLFFKKAETKFSAINVRDESVYSLNREGRKIVPEPFTSPVIRTAENNTSYNSEYPFVLFLGESNFFDVIYGERVFFDLARIPGSSLKIPCAAFVKGIINKSKKREVAEKLERLMEEKERLDKETFEQRYKAIKSANILSAEDLRVRLHSAEVVFH